MTARGWLTFAKQKASSPRRQIILSQQAVHARWRHWLRRLEEPLAEEEIRSRGEQPPSPSPSIVAEILATQDVPDLGREEIALSRTLWEIAQPITGEADHPERTSRIVSDLVSAWAE